MNARVLIFPDGHDPDSYVREHGAKAFLEFSEREALSFVDFKMRILEEGKNLADPQVQAALIKGMAETVALIPDRIQREMYVRHVAQQVDITEALMSHAVEEARRALGKLERRNKKREEARKAATEPAEVKELKGFEQLELASQEKEILRVMICHYDKSLPEDPHAPPEDEDGNPIELDEVPLLEFLMDELEELVFENQTYENLKNELFAEYESKGNIQLNHYLNHPDPAITQLVSSLLMHPETSPLWKKIRADISYDGNLAKVAEGPVLHYKSKKIEKLLREARDELKQAFQQENEEEEDRLTELIHHLGQMRLAIYRQIGTEGAVSGTDGSL